MRSKKHRGAGWVAAGWGVILALACSAERLADSLGGWCIVLGGIAVAFVLMRVGESCARRNPSTAESPRHASGAALPPLARGALEEN